MFARFVISGLEHQKNLLINHILRICDLRTCTPSKFADFKDNCNFRLVLQLFGLKKLKCWSTHQVFFKLSIWRHMGMGGGAVKI